MNAYILIFSIAFATSSFAQRDREVVSGGRGRAAPMSQRPQTTQPLTSEGTYCFKHKGTGDCPTRNEEVLNEADAALFINSCPQNCDGLNLVDRATWKSSVNPETCTSAGDIQTFKDIDELKKERGARECKGDDRGHQTLNSRLEKIQEPKCIPPLADPKTIVVHHTTDEGFGSVEKITPEGIQKSHVEGRGWSDIGYHFLIAMDKDGNWQVYEGRKWDNKDACKFQQGGHGGPGLNTDSIGIAIAGNYEKDSKPSFKGTDGSPHYPAGALKKLMQITAKLREVCPSLSAAEGGTIRGHGDHQKEGYGCVGTQCPGSGCQGIIDNLKGILQ